MRIKELIGVKNELKLQKSEQTSKKFPRYNRAKSRRIRKNRGKSEARVGKSVTAENRMLRR